MEKTEILTISKEELIKRRNLKKEKNYIEYRGSYIASLNAYNLYKQSHEDLFKYPCRLNTFFLLICKRGKGRVSINLNEYEIEDNTLFIYTPNHIICLNNELEESSEREGVMIGFDEHMPREVNFDIKQFLPLALQLKEHPVIKIAEEECDELLHIIQQLGKEIANAKEEAFQDEVIHTYFLLFFIKLCHIMNRTLHARPFSACSVKSRNEEYFHRFMQILSEHYKEERSLGFYASKLCITPKYLTTLIKKVSGRSASEWIDEYVILEAKNLLRYSSMSIQEVAYHLHFANQSFFGKYFKHQTGYSPSAYKLLK